MNREIPGYYYDAEKKKYFKIEASRTAPSDAAWSYGNVKRRKTEQREQEAEKQRAETRRRTTVKRARALEEPLPGAFLKTESMGRAAVGGIRVRAWAEGLAAKGGVDLWHELGEDPGMVSAMWVGGEPGATGDMGVVYGALNDEALKSSYLPRDEDDRIDFAAAKLRYPRTMFVPCHEPMPAPQLSSIKYHELLNCLFVTSRQPAAYPGLAVMSPSLARDDTYPRWLLGQTGGGTIYRVSTRSSHDCVVNTCAPAPAPASLSCVAGTSEGILRWREQDGVSWLTRRASGSTANPRNLPPRASSAVAASQREIFALDFLPLNPAEVVLFGGRSPTIGVIDLRTPDHEWFSLKHKSSVAHLKAVGEYEVLAAGPRNAMAVYDIRYIRDGANIASGQAGGNETRPVVRFAWYKNQAHIHIGLDVLVEPGLDGGVVAAAHDDGRLALFSLKEGARLRSPTVDSIDVRRGGSGDVVKSLVFATLPGDGQASLFVGERARINKYSFGKGDDGDGWL